jgi:hypothetical protein
MSTKTNFKRVALVAVAALGLGVLTSVAPASAVLSSTTLSVSTTSVGICASDSATGLTTIAMSKTGSLVIDVDGASLPAISADDTIKATGVLNITAYATITGAISVDQKKFTVATSNTGTVTFAPSGVGSATIYTQTDGSGANVQTVSVTVLDSCAGAAVASAGTSFIQVIDTADKYQTAANLGTTTQTTMTESGSTRTYGSILDTSVDYATSFTNNATAHLSVTARDAYKLPLAGTTYYYGLACTGPVVVNGGSTNGGFIAGVASQYTAQFTVAQETANTPVNTTCTVTVNNTVIGTKAITFKGDLAKIEAALYAIGSSGITDGTTGAGQISYKYFDAAGNRLATTGTGLDYPALTATGSALINAIASKTLTTATATGYVTYNCVDATASGDVSVVLKRTNAAGATISANAVTASCGGALDTYTASLDKAVYATGDIAVLTISGKDANGKAVSDATTAGTGAAITVSGMTEVKAPATTDTFSGGVLKYTYKVDNTAGNYVASVYLPSAGTQTAAATVKVTVGSQGVSNADVLKAIVSLIASINKQIAALQKALLKR